jgi:hypothetical protein
LRAAVDPKIADGTHHSRFIAVFLSKLAESPWVQKELDIVIDG